MAALIRVFRKIIYHNITVYNRTPSSSSSVLKRYRSSAVHEPVVNEDMPDPGIANPYLKEPRKCILCQQNIKVDYKNIQLLSQFISPYTGKIFDKHITGLCDKQQKIVESAIKHARHAGLMALYLKELRFVKDPKLFDPFRPQRPNPH